MTKEAAEKLAKLLKDISAHDIIWGPDIEVLEIPNDSIEGFIVEKIDKISEDTIVITANRV